MPVSFISGAAAAGNPTTSLSVTLPATEAGDIIALDFTHRGTGNGTIGGTSGLTFALKHSQTYGTSFSGKTYWARATGNHSGQTVTVSGLTDSSAGVVTVYRGAKASGDPLAAATIVGEANASGNETQAQITTTVDGAWVALVVANSPDVAVTSPACTSPGALQVRAEKLSTGGTDASIAHSSAEKASAGATGAFTWAQTNGASGSWAYAIEPEPVDTTDELGTPSELSAGAPTLASPALGQAHALTASGIASGAPTLGAPALEEQQEADELEAQGFSTGNPTLGTPSIGQLHALTAAGIASGAVVLGGPAIGQEHALAAVGVASGAPELGQPALGTQGVDVLTANGLASGAVSLGAPSIAQVHALAATGITTGAPVLGRPSDPDAPHARSTSVWIGCRIGI